MNDEDLYEHLGDISYQETFINYFDLKLAQFDGDWKAMLAQYFLQGPQPLLSGLVGGFGHPLILLADTFELQSPDLAVEALALTAIDYNDLCKFLLLSLSVGGANPNPTLSPQHILSKIRTDQRFNGLVTIPGVQNMTNVLSNLQARTALMEYMYMLNISHLPDLISELADLALLLLSATHKPDEPAFDFYLNHTLTFVYCLQLLLPVYPDTESSILLVRGVWLLTILIYITQLRPTITPSFVEDVEVGEGISWEDVFREFQESKSSEGKYLDPHFLRAMRNLMELGKMREEREVFYLKAAEKLKTQWSEWIGFGKEGEAKLNISSSALPNIGLRAE
ncbi:hypothetical protein OIDMADRAFT_60798 [Oidiodendron maius Zn]|uniref:Uncharacterized protein n=1 Tax=Oidiodendron maius (strain Zn) TaxID=913774 RepID=A0A0C3GVX7_OIDMZ|nr:hypothetical protein OIDMADRAFT_60798 [Oidiodendron maius Zn]